MAQEILRMHNINKKFPGVHALKDVDFNLTEGEIHGLVGENGAGKSTLMNVLMGMIRPDTGTITLKGEEAIISSPDYAIKKSIGMVPQELNVIPDISVAENVFMGIQNTKGKFVLDWKKTYNRAREIMEQLGSGVDVRKTASKCSVAQLQLVQMARTLAFDAKIIILDEPTASLTYQETRDLFKILHSLKDEGRGIIFISHHLEEVGEICERVTVMRDGEVVGAKKMSDTSIKEIITMMAGQDVIFSKFDRNFTGKDVVLKLEGLTSKHSKFKNVSFEVNKGEILGVGGLIGAGRTEVMLALFGAEAVESGKIYVNGKPVKIKSPQDAINNGIGYLPEERREQGIFPELSVRENMTMPILKRLVKRLAINRREQNAISEKYIGQLEIKTPSAEKKISDLSGGNQQKVIFARWIERDLDILILDEPTRGIDVRAKNEIHKLIKYLADKGKTIIVVSSEIEELINVSDRILVMNEGEVKGILDARTASQRDVLHMALGN